MKQVTLVPLVTLAYKSQVVQSLFLHLFLPYHHQPIYQNAFQVSSTRRLYSDFAISTVRNVSKYATHLKLPPLIIIDPKRMHSLPIFYETP